MAQKAFHLALSVSQGYGPKSWLSDWPGYERARWTMAGLFIDLAKEPDRCCFDCMIIENSSMVPYTCTGSNDTCLQYAAGTPKRIPSCWGTRSTTSGKDASAGIA